MARNAAWLDAHNPTLADIVGTAPTSDPVSARATEPVIIAAHRPQPYLDGDLISYDDITCKRCGRGVHRVYPRFAGDTFVPGYWRHDAQRS